MNRKTMAAVYSIAHFFVDFACAFIVLGLVYNGHKDAQLILLYNFFAFAIQMPIGIIADRFGRGHAIAALGCAFIAAAIPAAMLSGLSAVILAGLGNAMFHVGGGVYVLDEWENSSALGIFVSPGAIGLYLGTLLSANPELYGLVLIIMLITAAVIAVMPLKLSLDSRWGKCAPVPFDIKLRPANLAAALLFFIVVCIRSHAGFAMSFPWKTTAVAAFCAVVFTASGKAAGGFAADKLGISRAAVISMTAAALLYIFSDNIVCGFLAILLFNMSMPVTLRAAADIFKGGRGFSFGLLTFALYIGYIPSYLKKVQIDGLQMAVFCILSVVCLIIGFMLIRRRSDDSGNN